jgi:2,3-dihydroxybenzoate decarboxylase
MDEFGVDFMVLSLVTPGIQAISDPVVAEASATAANNALAAIISNNTMRFGAFAALSMHNATQAAEELRRTVTELGFLGALVNDFQQSGTDNGMGLFVAGFSKRLSCVSGSHTYRNTSILRHNKL